MPIKSTYAVLSCLLIYQYLCKQCFAQFAFIHTPPLFQVELEKDGCEKVDMLWCQGVQNIGLY